MSQVIAATISGIDGTSYPLLRYHLLDNVDDVEAWW
jgi:hypothetical protein